LYIAIYKAHGEYHAYNMRETGITIIC